MHPGSGVRSNGGYPSIETRKGGGFQLEESPFGRKKTDSLKIGFISPKIRVKKNSWNLPFA